MTQNLSDFGYNFQIKIIASLIKNRQFLLCCNLEKNMGRFTALYEDYKIGEKI